MSEDGLEPDDLLPDRQLAQLRIPPHSIEGESSVLGGLLLDNNAWDRVSDVVQEGDFYRYEHKLVFAAIGSLINSSRPADVITVFEHIQSQGHGDDIGGIAQTAVETVGVVVSSIHGVLGGGVADGESFSGLGGRG